MNRIHDENLDQMKSLKSHNQLFDLVTLDPSEALKKWEDISQFQPTLRVYRYPDIMHNSLLELLRIKANG